MNTDTTTPRGKLRYKHKQKEKERKSKRHRSHLSPPRLFDDAGWSPPPQAFKKQLGEEEWQQHLFDMMGEDEGPAFHATQMSMPLRWGVKHSSVLDEMSEEDYASYMRQGMWEKQHESELKERREREKARKRKEQRLAEENAKFKADEEKRERKREEKRH